MKKLQGDNLPIPQTRPPEPVSRLQEGEDFYWENGLLVFTRAYHLKRGYCCNSGCRHCPYEPQTS